MHALFSKTTLIPLPALHRPQHASPHANIPHPCIPCEPIFDDAIPLPNLESDVTVLRKLALALFSKTTLIPLAVLHQKLPSAPRHSHRHSDWHSDAKFFVANPQTDDAVLMKPHENMCTAVDSSPLAVLYQKLVSSPRHSHRHSDLHSDPNFLSPIHKLMSPHLGNPLKTCTPVSTASSYLLCIVCNPHPPIIPPPHIKKQTNKQTPRHSDATLFCRQSAN